MCFLDILMLNGCQNAGRLIVTETRFGHTHGHANIWSGVLWMSVIKCVPDSFQYLSKKSERVKRRICGASPKQRLVSVSS